jgi:hypothetical protein
MTIVCARRILSGLAVSVLLAVVSQAADLTAYVGGVKPGKLSVSGVKTALDGSPIFGFRLATDFVPMLGLEHTIAFSSDYLFPHNLSAITNPKGFVFNSNLIVNLPTGSIVPYLTAGVGLIHQYGNSGLPENARVGTKFAVNYGGGLKFPRMIGPIGARFDVRGYTAMGVFSNNLSMIEVTGGVLISLGH